MMRKRDIYEWAAEAYLTERLPEGWQDLPDSQLYDWIAQHTWEPLEHWRPEEVWEQIDSLAWSAISRFRLVFMQMCEEKDELAEELAYYKVALAKALGGER